ncbi:MAG: heme NO-binding domain-containing protein [Leptospirales bacterium]|nr:heme NO-binding domain-containing protein [Leptospirales bacterium]
MKMQIINCLSEMVKQNFGEDKWREVLKRSELNDPEKYRQFIKGMDIVDQKAIEVIMNTVEILGVTVPQAADAFGEHWVCKYAPRFYGNIYKRFQSAREFIEGMDKIHIEVTQHIANAKPPRFDIEPLSKTKIKVHYKSERDLITFYVGLIKGVGKYFSTTLDVKEISKEYVEISFPY